MFDSLTSMPPRKVARLLPCQLSMEVSFPSGPAITKLRTTPRDMNDGDAFRVLGYNLDLVGEKELCYFLRNNGRMRLVITGALELPFVEMSQVPPMFRKEVALLDENISSVEAIKAARELMEKYPELRLSRTHYHRLEIGKYSCVIRMSEQYFFEFEFPKTLSLSDSVMIKAHANGILEREL